MIGGDIAYITEGLSPAAHTLYPHETCSWEGLVGESGALRNAIEYIRIVAPTDSTVLVEGETGTGKDLVARAIHRLSPRRAHPFIKVNCAAIPRDLLESELFGHEKGAFTGAISQMAGRFELANRGTIFLDEVGDLPLELQPKLLRVLQEQEFERLGSGRTQRVDVRLVAATHRDLTQMTTEGKFRADLYYRLNVFPISVPPLRERKEDIPVLVSHFVHKFAEAMGKPVEIVPSAVMQAFIAHDWPGNIRELQNVVERAVILSPGAVLHRPDIRVHKPCTCPPLETAGFNEALNETERTMILQALRQCNWVIGGPRGAAARLGVKRTSLAYRMQKLGIERVRYQAEPC